MSYTKVDHMMRGQALYVFWGSQNPRNKSSDTPRYRRDNDVAVRRPGIRLCVGQQGRRVDHRMYSRCNGSQQLQP